MTEQELLEAIREARDFVGDSDAMTAAEICEATGLGRDSVRKRIKTLMDEGKMKVVWVSRETITTPLTGKLSKVPGYKPA